jgi:glucose/arabinose dehydrogenase
MKPKEHLGGAPATQPPDRETAAVRSGLANLSVTGITEHSGRGPGKPTPIRFVCDPWRVQAPMARTRWTSVRLVLLPIAIGLALGACAVDRPLRPNDISAPAGFSIDIAAEGLAAPTMATFDDQGRMIIAESGYGGSGTPAVTRIEEDGSSTSLVEGDAFGDELPVTAVAFHDDAIYVVHAGTVSIVDEGGSLSPVVTGLPGQGDHQSNQLVVADGWMYLGVGTVTNSAVVGTDNAVFGWLKRPERRQLHDVPCEEVRLTAQTFEAIDPLSDDGGRVTTSAYAAFGDASTAGAAVPGNVRCNGAILRFRPDGSALEVYAWGFRNPYGLEVGPDGAIYATMHGFDARGERPIEDAWDCFYRVEQGAWYGFPDFACDTPVTDPRFKPADQPQPQFLLAEHPTETPPTPIVRFDPHAATNGFDFAPSPEWGAQTDAFIALFGDFTPATGTVPRPVGVEVVKVDTSTGEISRYLSNKNSGAASTHSAGGLEHPSDVVFGPDGAMYVTDWGVAHITVDGLKLEPNSGVVWRIAPQGTMVAIPGGISFLYTLIVTFALSLGTFLVGGRAMRRISSIRGFLIGIAAAVVMGGAAIAISQLILNLPWYAPTRVFATMVMGRRGVANILDFEWLPFVVGLVVVVALGGVLGVAYSYILRTNQIWRVVLTGLVYGLTVWALLQYLILPPLFPLVAEKGFPPLWYAVTFAIYGLALGLFTATTKRAPASRHEMSAAHSTRADQEPT